MKTILISIFLIAIVGFLFWQFVLSPELSKDRTPPQWYNIGSSAQSVDPEKEITFFSQWSNNEQLDKFIFSWNTFGENCDVWQNDSAQIFTDKWSNVTKIIPSICEGKTISFKFYANDTSGNENVTEVRSFVVNECIYKLSITPEKGNVTASYYVWRITLNDSSTPVCGDYIRYLAGYDPLTSCSGLSIKAVGILQRGGTAEVSLKTQRESDQSFCITTLNFKDPTGNIAAQGTYTLYE